MYLQPDVSYEWDLTNVANFCIIWVDSISLNTVILLQSADVSCTTVPVCHVGHLKLICVFKSVFSRVYRQILSDWLEVKTSVWTELCSGRVGKSFNIWNDSWSRFPESGWEMLFNSETGAPWLIQPVNNVSWSVNAIGFGIHEDNLVR